MSELIFNEESHTYTVDGEVLPSVNDVLSGTGVQDFSFIPKADRERYFTRGTYVHLAMELLLKGELDWDTVDPSIEAHVRAGEKFIKDTGFKAIETEFSMYHPLWRYAGTPDCIGTIDGRIVIPDWKSGAVGHHVKWQTAAYGELFRVNEIATAVERYGVQLCNDGKYKMSEVWLDPNDLLEFFSFLTTFRNQVVQIEDGSCIWPNKGEW